jgi:hypothetical protein
MIESGDSTHPSYDFTGQVAFVTGAASGMGLATVRAFAGRVPPSSSPTSTRICWTAATDEHGRERGFLYSIE